MRRVVITGLGVVSPLGNSVNSFWNSIKEGKSGSNLITRFDTTNFKTKFACEVKGFNADDFFDRKEARKLDHYTQYALVAAEEAFRDAGLDNFTFNPIRAGIIWGSGYGGVLSMQEQVIDYGVHGRIPRFTPFFIPRTIINISAGLLSIKFGFKGINYAPTAACATSNVSILEGFNQIKWGKADLIIAGGSEAAVTETGVGGFNALGALSTNNEHFETACCPFDTQRDGFVLGEGAGALIIEEMEHAQRRGAKIYAEIIGGAMTADAYHITASHPEGEGAISAMKLALSDAQINTSDVDYINAHATSTPLGDISELLAIKNVFGQHSDKINISATKSMTGHLLGAAGAAEAIICIKSITDSVVAPTINTQNIDPALPQGLNLTIGKAINRSINIALNNTFGFGGHNVITVFKKISL